MDWVGLASASRHDQPQDQHSHDDEDSDAEYGAAENKMCPDEEPKTAA
jgi:hypothetical protein